jgi:uncharacterized membrane protein YqiK
MKDLKESVPLPVFIAVIVAIILVVGVIGWKVFGSNSGRVDPAQSAITRARKQKDG